MDNRNDGVLDLGTPVHMVGFTGFTKHAGGGQCVQCGHIFASLMPDKKCAGCSSAQTAVDKPTEANCPRR